MRTLLTSLYSGSKKFISSDFQFWILQSSFPLLLSFEKLSSNDVSSENVSFDFELLIRIVWATTCAIVWTTISLNSRRCCSLKSKDCRWSYWPNWSWPAWPWVLEKFIISRFDRFTSSVIPDGCELNLVELSLVKERSSYLTTTCSNFCIAFPKQVRSIIQSASHERSSIDWLRARLRSFDSTKRALISDSMIIAATTFLTESRTSCPYLWSVRLNSLIW